jgi:hypothetical protein
VHEPEQRRRLGAWYTPEALVGHVVAAALEGTDAAPRRVLDPACGDGRFLEAVRTALAARGHSVQVCGVDVDPQAIEAARARLGPTAELIGADALQYDWGHRKFDLIIGNPPFLSPLTAGNTAHLVTRGARYADTAVAFWHLAHRLAEPRGARVAFVLPVSVLASRDAGPVRADVAQRAALRWWWWADTPVFPDAQVITGAVVTECGGAPEPVRRRVGVHFDEAPSVMPPTPITDTWGWLVADALGLPAVGLDTLNTAGTVAQRVAVRGDFRDQYYGLIGAVDDAGDGPPLVTSGLIDPGTCRWGERPVRFAGRRFMRPTVDLQRLSPRLQAWARRRLVPKVLVASQTKVIEAVADPNGAWLPGVPVISALPGDGVDVWDVAAVLSSPVASLWLAHRSAGTGRSARVVRVSAPVLAEVPWPRGDLSTAAAAMRNGDLDAAARATLTAYGVNEAVASGWTTWWRSALPRGVR